MKRLFSLVALLMLSLTAEAASVACRLDLHDVAALMGSGIDGAPFVVGLDVKINGAVTDITHISNQNQQLKSSYATLTSEFKIRKHLSQLSEKNADGLNEGENIISLAMHMSRDEELARMFNLGFDLNDISFIRLHRLGANGVLGFIGVVEAFDAQRRPLGRFAGGLMALPCL